MLSIPGKKAFVASLLKRTRLTSLIPKLSPALLIVLAYHRIRPEEPGFDPPFDRGVFGPTVTEFEEQVGWLCRHYRILSEAELLALIARQAEPTDPCAVITFDDAYKDNYRRARPVLERHGAPAIFFVASDIVERRRLGWWDQIAYLVKQTALDTLLFRGETFALGDRVVVIRRFLRAMKSEPAERTERFVEELASACQVELPSVEAQDAELMTWDELRESAGGVIAIGSHTHTHRVLSTLPTEVQRNELARSKYEIERHIGKEVRTVAFPTGGANAFTARTMQLAQETGYTAAFSYLGPAPYNRWRSLQRFNLRRLCPPDSFAEFAATVALPSVFAR
ncbi:MAG: polysaccharide deacetylase family protein [Myxococcales bacterium]